MNARFGGRVPRGVAALCAALILVALGGSGAAAEAFAGEPVAGGPIAGEPVAGNYCIACHTVNDARLERGGEWRGSVAGGAGSACPGLRAVEEQRYYVERQLLAAARLGGDAGAGLNDRYARLLDLPLTGVDAFEAEAQAVGYAGGKTYAALNATVENGKRLRVLLGALAVTAFLLFALGWGLRNTLKAQPARLGALWRPGPRGLALLGLALVLFALPLFRAPPAAVATSSAEAQAAQAEFDTASRAAAVAERGLARAALLGEIGAAWAQIDRARGEAILAEALAAEEAARAEADALWGRGQAAEEAAAGSATAREKAALVSAELLAARHRAWALRAIAEHWAGVDAEAAQALLARAEAVARRNPTVYGELDLAAIAAARGAVAAAHRAAGEEAARSVECADDADCGDGGECAAARTRDCLAAGQFGPAWDAAGRIADDWERGRAQAAIAGAWGNADAARRIAVPALRDRALRTIAVATGDAALARSIASPYERVTALAGAGQAAEAAAHAGELTEKSALVAVIAALAPTQPADALALVDRLTREADKAEALAALAVATGDPALFSRALGMAAAARVRGDALAGARASLDLARAFLGRPGGESNALAALTQAYELASKISVKRK